MHSKPSPLRIRGLSATVTAVLAAACTVAVVLSSSLSCNSKKKAKVSDLVVSTHWPKEQSTESEPIQIRFEEPVVADEAVGVTLETLPVSIQPAFEATAHWLDRQSLFVAPVGSLAPSTRYNVKLVGQLGDRTGGYSFSFVHEPLVVEGIWNTDLDNVPIEPTLPLHFNQPVASKDVVSQCHLQKLGDKKSVIKLVSADTSDTSDQVSVKPNAPLTKDTDYELVCDGLVGYGGNTAMTVAYVQQLHTHPQFALTSSKPGGDDVPADDVEIEFTFSTPVTLDEIRANLKAKPRIVSLDQGWLDRSGTTYKATATLKSLTKYKITLSGDIKDRFGQTLGQEKVLKFKTGSARPRLSLETGIYALEASAPGYPVWSRNVSTVNVKCANVPKSKVVKLLTSSMDYDPWYDAGAGEELGWKELGLKKKDRQIKIDQPKNKWHLTNLAMHEVCGGKKRGLFMAEMNSPDVEPDEDHPWRYRAHRRVLANVTDFGILLEAGTASGIIWVTSLATGKPVPGANVTIYTPKGRLAHRGKTDNSGILRIPGTTQLLRQPGADDKNEFDDGYDYWSYRSQRLIAIVEKGADLGVVDGNWANGIQTWNFGVRTDRSSGKTRIRGFIQSDRGIYRPGEKVHFKGIVREIAVNKPPKVPKNARVTIHVEDSRGQGIYDKKTRLTRFGGFSFDLKLQKEANLGDYYVTATIKGQKFRERFSVEEFRKVSYEIDLKGTERHTRLGSKLRFQVDANYLFGAPVTSAQVEWNVQRRSHSVRFPKFAQYDFGDGAARGYFYYDYYDDDYGSRYLDFVADGDGETNRRGKFKFSVRDSQKKFSGPQDYVVGVSVRDETDQVVTKQTVITAHKTDFYVGLHTQEWVQAVDMPFAINTVALSPTGEHVGTKAKLKFIRETYECTYSGGYRAYRSCKQKQEVEMERDIEIPATGTGTERIMPKKPGEYIMRVETKDSRGNDVVASGYVWVIGKGEAFWSGDESARMSLIASKDSYKPGETARIVPRTGMKNATALITLKRNGIMDAYVKELESSADGIEIPLTDLHAPNVFASVAMVSGRSGEGDRNRPRFKLGMTELKVATDNQRLDVAVTLDKDEYEPGETVTGTIKVTNQGQPVVAEVSVSVADEGVLQLIGYKTPDPMSTFYALWGLGIDSSTNWNRIARLNDPASDDPDHGGDSGPGGDDSVRSNFVSSAFWEPNLVTDASGQVTFTFTAPDNLTAFRTMAVAADEGTRFGSGERRLTIKKPLLAKPILPRFLNSGDYARVGVVVHNYTGQAGQATVTATVQGVYLKNNTQTVDLDKDGSKRVVFPIKALKQRKATFEFAVEMSTFKDALRLDVPLHRPLDIQHRTVIAGIGGREGKDVVATPVSWEDTLVTNRSYLTVTVDRTGLGDLAPSLRYLVRYPYGCLEQTLSKFIPLTKVKDLAASMNMKELKGPKINTFIRAGVAKVARHQHSDGHFSLWPSGKTYPHLTVYALYGLSEAKRAGIKVPQEVIDRGVNALQSWTAQQKPGPGGEIGTMAMAAYVLAELGKPDTGLVSRLYEARNALPGYGMALLLRAMKRTNARAGDLAKVQSELIAMANIEGENAIVREKNPEWSYYMGTDARSSAIALSALLEVAPNDAIIDKLVAGLKSLRKSGGRWRNTQDNLYALVALADYARKETQGKETVEVKLDGRRLIRKTLKGAKVMVLRRPLHKHKPGQLEISTTGKVRYAVRVSEAREIAADTPVDKGFAVTRTYLDPKTEKPVEGNLKTGQLIKVRVEIKVPENRRFVAVEDPLPAGFEAVNTKLKTSANVTGAKTRSGWGWTHREMRDDRVLGFVDNMYRKDMKMEYLVRATTAGTYVAPPPRAEEMYSPEVYGQGVATKVVIKKR